LSNITVNGWANSEIVCIIMEQNTEIACAFDSRKKYSCLCPQNLMRQSITARWSVFPWDMCTVPGTISHKSNWRPVNFIPFEVFSMGIFVNAMASPFLN
jgi:hypothetical protein